MSVIQHQGKEVVPLWINSAPHPISSSSSDSPIFPVINALSGLTIHHAVSATPTTAHLAVSAASAAFPSWSLLTPPASRRALLLRAASLLEARASEISACQVNETSCAPIYADFMAKLGPRIIREIAGSMTTALTGSCPPTDLDQKGGFAYVVKEAVGPVLLISPWNSPPVLCTRGIASALAAGCTVVLKGSELCPRLHGLLVSCFEDAGLPRGVLNMVQCPRESAAEVTEALIGHPDMRKIEFIGSAAVGKVIGQVAAKYLKPVLMELGGKSPAIVLEDANLRQAALMCAMGAFAHHGQICMSTERIIVVRSVADEFVELLKGVVAKFFGSGDGKQQQQQSAASKGFADKAHDMVAAAVANGASYVVGDNSYTNPPHLTGLTPTIVSGVQKDDVLRDAESFGPSASLYIVDDVDQAVSLANETASGLNASLWTEDALAAVHIARRLHFGQVHVNGSTTSDEPQLSVTGTRGSGWGSNNAAWGVGEFLVNKTITVQDSKRPGPFGV